jgi:NitT/TauT family transport system substrate-binding protein
VKATLRGLDDIMKQGKAVVPDYIAGAPPFKGKEKFVEEVVVNYIEYTYKGQKQLGAMDPERLARVQKFYVSEKIVPKEVPVNELYTNQFVQ